jgi:hypothetical protein
MICPYVNGGGMFLGVELDANPHIRCSGSFAIEWFLFDYKSGVPDVESKPFKTKADAEKARQKYPVRERGGIGVGIS